MRSFLIEKLGVLVSLPYCRSRRTKVLLGYPHLHHNAFLFFNSFASNQPKQQQEQVTVSYLINSCCLSPNVATELSKRVQRKNPDAHDSVLNFLRNYGFSETQIFKLVVKWPTVLSAKPEKTVLPKFVFFQSIGLSRTDIPELFIRNPYIIRRSLKKWIMPRYEAIKSVVVDDEKVLGVIKGAGWCFTTCSPKHLISNVKVLREHGVPQSSVSLLVTLYTTVAFMKHAKFVESVKFAEETGFDPQKTDFIKAINVFTKLKKSVWDSRFLVYERWGWSRDVTFSAFKKHPLCMLISEDKITKSMRFLVDEMCLSPEDIARYPLLLCYNLEKRVIPRCSVVKVLKMKDLVKNDLSILSIVTITEKKFLEKYVIGFQESVPQLLRVYEGQVGALP